LAKYLFGPIGGVYPDQAGPAFAIFNFAKCIAAAAGFIYAGRKYQVLNLFL
jgi:hypothetical protein